MRREVHLQQVFLAVNGQSILVHQGRSIIITVSVKCHSGKSLENGTPGERHPKIQHIHQEAVSTYYLHYSLYGAVRRDAEVVWSSNVVKEWMNTY